MKYKLFKTWDEPIKIEVGKTKSGRSRYKEELKKVRAEDCLSSQLRRCLSGEYIEESVSKIVEFLPIIISGDLVLIENFINQNTEIYNFHHGKPIYNVKYEIEKSS